MKLVLILATVTAAALIAGDTGIRPRAGASDYPASKSGAGVALGAVALSPEQVKKLFAVDLTKMGYIVVEVGVYPEPSKTVETATRDFLLRVGNDGSTVRPASPATIAARLQKKDSPPPRLPERVQVHGSETIGYETGSYGGRRASGVYTESTVGVGVGAPGDPPPPPPPSKSGKDKDSLSVQVDLENQALPQGRFTEPVAGYLYFPATASKKASLELTWYGADGQLHLALPATK